VNACDAKSPGLAIALANRDIFTGREFVFVSPKDGFVGFIRSECQHPSAMPVSNLPALFLAAPEPFEGRFVAVFRERPTVELSIGGQWDMEFIAVPVAPFGEFVAARELKPNGSHHGNILL
jgi:hypothetical protein